MAMRVDRGMDVNGLKLNWVRTGPEGAPTVVLIHAVGLDLTYWDRQVEALRSAYRVVAFDVPGHGRSAALAQWSFEALAGVVAGLIEEVGAGAVHLVGLSFGGMVAQATALARPELVRSLTLIGTASTFPEAARGAMRARAETVRSGGMAAVLPASLERCFRPETRLARPDLMDRVSKTVLGDDPEANAAIWEMISGFEVRTRLREIGCPALVLVGDRDASTPPAMSAVLAEEIGRARMVVVPGASHMVPLEAPEAVNVELIGFLAGL